MAIFEVTSTEIVQRCGKCDSENRIPVTAITVGIAHGVQTDARTIRLPACPTCASTEFLIRSPDDETEYPTPGSFGHRHRMLVDHLHAELVKADRLIPALLDSKGHADQKLARPVAPESRDRWFPTGMKIAAPAIEVSPAPKEGISTAPVPAAAEDLK